MEVSTRWLEEAFQSKRAQLYQSSCAWMASLLMAFLLLGSALLLIARRGAGALAQPLPGSWLVFVGLCVATAVVGTRKLSRKSSGPTLPGLGLLIQWGPTLAVAMFGVALAIEGTSLPALTLYLVLIVGAEFFSDRAGRAARSVDTARFVSPRDRSNISTADLPTAEVSARWPVAEDESELAAERNIVETLAEFPLPSSDPLASDHQAALTETWSEAADLSASDPMAGDPIPTDDPMATTAWQQTTRVRTDAGELITGWVKAEFQPGERTAVLHLAFCPPLAAVPEMEVEQLAGPTARIKAAQILPQGVRLEVRLNVPAVEDEMLLVGFVATEPA